MVATRDQAAPQPQSWQRRGLDQRQVRMHAIGWWILGLGLLALLSAEGSAEPLALLGGAAWCSVGLGWFWVRQQAPHLQLRLQGGATLRAGARSELLLELYQGASLGAARDLLLHVRSEGAARRKDASRHTPPVGAHVPHLRPGVPTTVPVVTRFPERGHWRRLRVEVRSSDPLGLFTTLRSYLVDADLRVLPRVGRSRLLREHAQGRMGTQSQVQRRGDEEFFALREHRLGESLSRVHWKHSLRRGRRLVRELTRDTEQRLHFVLCCQVEQAPTYRAAFEEAVSLCATLIEEATQVGLRSGLTLLTETPRQLAEGQGQRHGRILCEALCTVESHAGDPTRAWSEFAERSDHPELWVVLVGSGEEPAHPSPGVRLFDVLDPSIGRLFQAFPVYAAETERSDPTRYSAGVR